MAAYHPVPCIRHNNGTLLELPGDKDVMSRQTA